jgi:hypothetical protein
VRSAEYDELERVAERFPVAWGRHAKGALQRTRAEAEQTGRLIDATAGKRRPRKPTVQTKIFEDLNGQQQALIGTVEALLLRGMAWDVDIAAIAGHLRRTQYVARHAEDLALRTQDEIAQVADAVAELAEYTADLETRLTARFDGVDERIASAERRLYRIEAELAASRSLEDVVGRWKAGKTYTGIPWVYAVALLAYEVFAGPVGQHELLSHEQLRYERLLLEENRFREQLTERVLTAGTPWAGRRAAADVIAEAASELGTGVDGQRVAEYLGEGLDASLDGPRGSLVLALRAALLGDAPGTAGNPELDGLRLTAEGLCGRLVFEQAETVLALRNEAWAPELGLFGGVATEAAGD